MVEEFNRLCLFRQFNPGIRGSGLSVNDPILIPVVNDLLSIKNTLQTYFANYKGFNFSVEISKGQANFPSVFHISILPPSQKVSNGIYVVMCFDIKGRGAVVGCAESITHSKGLRTVKRKKSKGKLNIDVDGLRTTTKYNNTFQNPIEFFYGLESDSGLLSHIEHSIDIALIELNLIPKKREILSQFISEDFDPTDLNDGRDKVAKLITARRGQKKFRDNVLKAYGFKCAITGDDVEQVIEAAHIIPYLGEKTNHIQNGIPLRSDIHLLFDLGLLTISAKSFKIKISKKLACTNYWKYNAKTILIPQDKFNYPSIEALKYHNQIFEDKEKY